MQAIKRRSTIRRGGIVYLPTDEIQPCCVQPRQRFNDEDTEELARSIAEHGILNPLTVRLRGGSYELVAGERRLRAAKLLGLGEVPCTVLELSMEEASLVALVENLQRRDLDFVEEAQGIRRLLTLFGMNQEEAARRLGRSQPSVANKLRILRLPEDVLDGLITSELTERHARALLRLPDSKAQREALTYIAAHKLNVAQSEAYIDSLIKATEEKTSPKRVFIMKDLRIFENSVLHGLELLRSGGINADFKREETDDALLLHISIPKP